MRNANTAEWILRLVTTPERAACTTGDLLEEAAGRSAFWFWWGAVRIASRQVWGDLCAHRGQMAWLAFSSLLAGWLLGAVLGMMVIPLWTALAPYNIAPNATYVPPWGHYCLLASLVTVVPLVVGWDVASRSEGRELPAAFAVTILLAATHATRALIAGTLVRRVDHPYPYVENVLAEFGTMALCVMAGAILCRLRGRARTKVAG